MATMRGAHAMAAAHGRLFAMGGFDGVSPSEGGRPGFLDVVEMYDPRMDMWAPAAPMAECRAYGAAVTLDGRLHVVGGMTGVAVNSKFEVFDSVAGTWETARGPAPDPRYFLGATVVLV